MNRMMQARLRAACLIAGLSLVGLSLAGCGFTPLYAQQGVTPGLSAVSIHVPHGRTAFLLGQDLEDALAINRSAPPLYRLDVTLDERNYPRGLRVNDVATRNETHVSVTYRLIDLTDGKLLKAGNEPIEVTYAVADQPYAGVAAEQDAQARAASTAADRIRLDLALYFANR